MQNFKSVNIPSNLASTETYILTPESHFYLVPKHSYNYFRFCGSPGSGYGFFVMNYVELHAGRCSTDLVVLENLYLDAEIAFISRTDA